jgi:hypothetical protein
MRRFFAPDEEKCEAFLRAQKNVAEKNRTKGASPTAVFRSPSRQRRRSAYSPVMCSWGVFYYFFIPLCYYVGVKKIYSIEITQIIGGTIALSL